MIRIQNLIHLIWILSFDELFYKKGNVRHNQTWDKNQFSVSSI